MSAIAFLGLGAMGSRMAAHLLAAGHDLSVWNRDHSKAKSLVDQGARLAASPRQAAVDADIVIAMTRDDGSSRDVWLSPESGALSSMKSGAIAIECSTLSSAWIKELHTEAQLRGVPLIDAPVVGSRPQAEATQLIFLVGSDMPALTLVQPVLSKMGAAVHHVGPVGAGTRIKLAINALFAVQVATMAELLNYLNQGGFTPQHALEIISSTPVLSMAAKGAGASMVSGNFAPMFPVELVEKDLSNLKHDITQEQRGSTPISDAAYYIFKQGLENGLGELNLTSVYKLYADR
jgi:3-hydroxyisobutyrate dehydrogenase